MLSAESDSDWITHGCAHWIEIVPYRISPTLNNPRYRGRNIGGGIQGEGYRQRGHCLHCPVISSDLYGQGKSPGTHHCANAI